MILLTRLTKNYVNRKYEIGLLILFFLTSCGSSKPLCDVTNIYEFQVFYQTPIVINFFSYYSIHFRGSKNEPWREIFRHPDTPEARWSSEPEACDGMIKSITVERIVLEFGKYELISTDKGNSWKSIPVKK
jgi:hypothetical protein